MILVYLAELLLLTGPEAAGAPGQAVPKTNVDPASFDRNDLEPDRGPFHPADPYLDALRDELVGNDREIVVMMLSRNCMMTPESAVLITKRDHDTKVILRRYKTNFCAAGGREETQSQQVRRLGTREGFRTTPRVPHPIEVFEADLDTTSVDALRSVWSRMLDRTQRKPARPRIIIRDGTWYHFSDSERAGICHSPQEGSFAADLVALGGLLSTYVSSPLAKRSGLRNSLVAAARSLEIRIDHANSTDNPRFSPALK